MVIPLERLDSSSSNSPPHLEEVQIPNPPGMDNNQMCLGSDSCKSLEESLCTPITVLLLCGFVSFIFSLPDQTVCVVLRKICGKDFAPEEMQWCSSVANYVNQDAFMRPPGTLLYRGFTP